MAITLSVEVSELASASVSELLSASGSALESEPWSEAGSAPDSAEPYSCSCNSNRHTP
jgi:hypothetical protein